jgi:flagellar protein FliS
MYGRVSSNYNRVGIETADQKTLILICYDEAISSLRRGRECSLNNRFEEKARQYNRAQDFIGELSSSLNLEAGGEIALYLRKIYQFIQTNILMADVKKDIKIIDHLISLLTELRSAWAEIDTRPAAGLAYSKNQVVPEAARGFAV